MKGRGGVGAVGIGIGHRTERVAEAKRVHCKRIRSVAELSALSGDIQQGVGPSTLVGTRTLAAAVRLTGRLFVQSSLSASSPFCRMGCGVRQKITWTSFQKNTRTQSSARAGGRDAFFLMRGIDPGVPVLIASGFPEGADIEELTRVGALFLQKPYTVRALEHALNTLLARAPSELSRPLGQFEPDGAAVAAGVSPAPPPSDLLGAVRLHPPQS